MNQPLQFRKAYISFGANLPFANNDPAATLCTALRALDEHDLQLVQCSSLWSSPAWPNPNDPPFVNMVAGFMSHLSPLRLLNQLGRMETRFGRVRGVRNAPRTLDLDLIAYGQLQCATERVMLPHPRATERAFVLLPLAEVAPNWIHPKTGVKISKLIDALAINDRKSTKVIKAVQIDIAK
ncbi:MAG: 2-amino-4-hydroxy-6-hydroxymethyldihydropteridine diphosphokinase [Robiginitomaculum sp.]|nr:2-amino-4-hydroxy-6-hydroxymethyldihydropteridine diphosphokinase [Robiginitomaculum sp.]